jgi:hypothetical protein
MYSTSYSSKYIEETISGYGKYGICIMIIFAAINFQQKMNNTYHSDLTVQGAYYEYLRLLEHWDRGFESHSGQECISMFFFCLWYSVLVEAFRKADYPLNGPHQISKEG